MHLNSGVSRQMPTLSLIHQRHGGFITISEGKGILDLGNTLKFRNLTPNHLNMKRIYILAFALAVVACGENDSSPSGADSDGQFPLYAFNPLRTAAEKADFYWGAASAPHHLDDPAYAEALASNFTIHTAENVLKFPHIHPKPGVYDFSDGDKLAEFARANGQKMRGHVLIWREDLSPWLGENPSREAAVELMREHIFTVLGHYRQHYPDVFVQWDVVNEAFRSDGTLRDSGWHRAIGDDFIELAFQFARQAWPELELFYNDFFEFAFNVGGSLVTAGGELDPDAIRPGLGSVGPLASCDANNKCAGVRSYVQNMVAKGIPIDAIGFQAHIGTLTAPDYPQLAMWIEELGLRWALTELDSPCGPDESGQLNEELCYSNQAQIFSDAVKGCIDSPYCNTVVQWGVADPYSWWPGLSQGALANPLVLDGDFEYKPAADAVLEVLVNAAE